MWKEPLPLARKAAVNWVTKTIKHMTQRKDLADRKQK